jgi:hypothetical protein
MKRRSFLLSFLLTVSMLGLPEPSFGRTVMPTLEALTKGAKVIVVAQVEEVVTVQPENSADASGVRQAVWEKRVATAKVLDVWKGTAGEKVQFRASRTWACDVSTAIAGETVILFLADDPKDSVMAIAYWGIGRLPVENPDGNSTVLLYSNLLTREIKELIGVPKDTFRSYVDVAMFKQQIQQIELGKTARAK